MCFLLPLQSTCECMCVIWEALDQRSPQCLLHYPWNEWYWQKWTKFTLRNENISSCYVYESGFFYLCCYHHTSYCCVQFESRRVQPINQLPGYSNSPIWSGLYSWSSGTLLFRDVFGLPFQSWNAAKRPACHYSEWPACSHCHHSSNLWKRVHVMVMRIAIRLFFSVMPCIFIALLCSPNNNPAIMSLSTSDIATVWLCVCVRVSVWQIQMGIYTQMDGEKRTGSLADSWP